MYTDDEIHEIREREADKWRSYIREKDEIIDLLKYTIESLSNRKIIMTLNQHLQ